MIHLLRIRSDKGFAESYQVYDQSLPRTGDTIQVTITPKEHGVASTRLAEVTDVLWSYDIIRGRCDSVEVFAWLLPRDTENPA